MDGFINIIDNPTGKVTFGAQGSNLEASFVKSIKEFPYNIPVVQISQPLQSDVAEAPTPSSTKIDFIFIMAKKGCKTYSNLITAGTEEVAKMLDDKVNGSGLILFCPISQAMKAFMPKFKYLTQEQMTSMLLYLAFPSYNSIEMLKSKNGLATTLAIRSTKLKDFYLIVKSGEEVVLESRGAVASTMGTLADKNMLALFKEALKVLDKMTHSKLIVKHLLICSITDRKTPLSLLSTNIALFFPKTTTVATIVDNEILFDNIYILTFSSLITQPNDNLHHGIFYLLQSLNVDVLSSLHIDLISLSKLLLITHLPSSFMASIAPLYHRKHLRP